MLVRLFFLSSVFYYAMVLIALAFCLLYVVFTINFLVSYLPLLIILVYIGAIMVIVGYICSVIPNEQMYKLPFSIFYFFVPVLFNLFLHIPQNIMNKTVTPKPLAISDIFYFSFGVEYFVFLVLLLLFLLLITSFSISHKSTFRRV